MNAQKLIDTAKVLVAGDKGLLAMDESKEISHESNTFVSTAIEPIYQYRLWGGRRLANLLTAPAAGRRPYRRSVDTQRPR